MRKIVLSSMVPILLSAVALSFGWAELGGFMLIMMVLGFGWYLASKERQAASDGSISSRQIIRALRAR